MTQTPHLDACTVAKAALKAHAEGRLAAQQPAPRCLYQDPDGCPCAIGAGMRAELINRLREGNLLSEPIVDLIRDRVVTTSSTNDLISLQKAHDRWANRRRNPSRTFVEVKSAEADFLRVAREIAKS